MLTLPVIGLLEGAEAVVRFCPGSTETERGGPPVFSGVGPWLGEAMTTRQWPSQRTFFLEDLIACSLSGEALIRTYEDGFCV